MEEELEIITIGSKDYAVIDEIENYVFLSNIDNELDVMVRKSIKEKDKEKLVALDTEEEFNKAMILFTKKNKDLLKEE